MCAAGAGDVPTETHGAAGAEIADAGSGGGGEKSVSAARTGGKLCRSCRAASRGDCRRPDANCDACVDDRSEGAKTSSRAMASPSTSACASAAARHTITTMHARRQPVRSMTRAHMQARRRWLPGPAYPSASAADRTPAVPARCHHSSAETCLRRARASAPSCPHGHRTRKRALPGFDYPIATGSCSHGRVLRMLAEMAASAVSGGSWAHWTTTPLWRSAGGDATVAAAAASAAVAPAAPDGAVGADALLSACMIVDGRSAHERPHVGIHRPVRLARSCLQRAGEASACAPASARAAAAAQHVTTRRLQARQKSERRDEPRRGGREERDGRWRREPEEGR